MWLQIKLFVIALVLIPVLDYLWLGKVMSGFYLRELGALARTEGGQFRPQLLPALCVYVCLALGLVMFVMSWVEGWGQALAWSALLGFIIYGVYDLTNLSVIEGYSVTVSLVDMAWGTTLCGVVGLILFYLRGLLA